MAASTTHWRLHNCYQQHKRFTSFTAIIVFVVVRVQHNNYGIAIAAIAAATEWECTHPRNCCMPQWTCKKLHCWQTRTHAHTNMHSRYILIYIRKTYTRILEKRKGVCRIPRCYPALQNCQILYLNSFPLS